MKLQIITIIAVFTLTILLPLASYATPQTICPVMGNAINKAIFADHKGERVYFCCQGCPPMFKKNPDKYLKKMKKAGITPEVIAKEQTLCPVMGNAINKKLYLDHKGERIYFCCQGCLPMFKKDPEKFLKKMHKTGVTPEKLPLKVDKKMEMDHKNHNHTH
jgi:YHS domain-containing protein